MIKVLNSNSIDAKPDYFDRIIEVLLIALLAFMPLAFGAVEAWSEEIVVLLTGAIFICFLLKLIFEENRNLIWSWAYIPAVFFILLAVFQLIQLPSGFINTISSNTAVIKNDLLSDLPDSQSFLKYMTLSFYPNATKHDIRLILCIFAVFFIVINVYRRPHQIKRLLAEIAIIGGLIAVLALAQNLFGNGKIYWIIAAPDRASSGTFVNHSHYGQFMNLSIGAALGLIIIKLHEMFSGKKINPQFVYERLSSPETKHIWLLASIIILGATTIFISLTRGGIISMLMASGLTILFLSSRSRLRGQGWIMVLIALGAFICILYIGLNLLHFFCNSTIRHILPLALTGLLSWEEKGNNCRRPAW